VAQKQLQITGLNAPSNWSQICRCKEGVRNVPDPERGPEVKLHQMIENHSLITIQPEDSLELAMQVMLWGGVRHLPVVDKRRLVGVLSQRDLLTHQARVGDRAAARSLAKEIMSVPPITAGPHNTFEQAIDRMVNNRVGCLPVVEKGKVLGIVTRSDFLAQRFRQSAGRNRAADAPPVTDVMKTDLVTAHQDDPLLDAIARMEKRSVRHLPVVDGEDRLVGMLSDRDVRTAFGNALRPLGPGDAHVRFQNMHVEDAMAQAPFSVSEHAALDTVARHFVDRRIGAIPIVAEDRTLKGIVSYVDVIRALVPTPVAYA